MPFLVAVGQLPEAIHSSASSAISLVWGIDLLKCHCKLIPNEFLQGLSDRNALVHLEGDAAKFTLSKGSWLEALGAWKMQVVLLTSTIEDGSIPGTVPAYVSLCKEFSIPLIGIIQLGGNWDPIERKQDGLPWCGFFSSDVLKINVNKHNIHSDEFLDLKLTVEQIRYRSNLMM